MRRRAQVKGVAILASCALLTAGCASSDDTVAPQATSQQTTTQAAPETTPAPESKAARSYRELMAGLPQFDEPASPEVAAWRKATFITSFRRCASSRGGADEATFVSANRRVLKEVAVFRGARFVNESSIAQKDGNGCPEGLGPATYYVTHRSYRLPEGTKPETVLSHYQREFYGWVAASSTAACERTFGQGPAYVVVAACNGVLRVSVRARAPVQVAQAASPPPRPLGLQYPIVEGHLATPKPTGFESEPGVTCERVHGSEVPSIIIPPAPGIRAAIRGKQVVVRWSLGTVHGDCPPSDLIFSYPAATASTIHERVHAASGVTRLRLLAGLPRPKRVTARAVSVDGTESRAVAVLIREPK